MLSNRNFIRWLISWKVLPTVVLIRNLARKSVGVYVCAKVLELRHTIKLIQILDGEIAEIEERIQNHMQEIDSPIESIPGISFRLKQKSATLKDFLRRIIAFDLPIWKIHVAKCSHGKTWFPLFALCIVLSCSSCQQIFKNFCRLFEEKARRR